MKLNCVSHQETLQEMAEKNYIKQGSRGQE